MDTAERRKRERWGEQAGPVKLKDAARRVIRAMVPTMVALVSGSPSSIQIEVLRIASRATTQCRWAHEIERWLEERRALDSE